MMMGTVGLKILPPLIIYPQVGVTQKSYKILAKLLKSFLWISTQHGYPVVYFHDCMFAMSPKGGMNAKLFTHWFLVFLALQM